MRYLALLAGLACCVGAGPTTRPAAATRPTATTRPVVAKPAAGAAAVAPARVRDGLVNGSVRFLVPAGWEIVDRAENGFGVRYRADGETEATIGIVVTPQPQGIPAHDPRVRGLMARQLLPAITEDLKKRGVEVVDAPRAVPDDRFMLKVHARFRDDGHMLDVLHMYRGIGFNLIDVTVSAATEDKAAAKVVHDLAAQVAMSVTVGAQDPKIVRPFKKGE